VPAAEVRSPVSLAGAIKKPTAPTNAEVMDFCHCRSAPADFGHPRDRPGVAPIWLLSLALIRLVDEHRFRSSIRSRSGCGRRLVRRPDRDAGVRPRPASLMWLWMSEAF
jgi:hypothetical protein